MNRQEAEQLVGSLVVAWTAANGEYVGRLLQVLPARPWRALVEVTGVLKPAQHYERGAVCRRGFRPGESVEVGGASVRLPRDNDSPEDYLTALLRERSGHLLWLQRFEQHPDRAIQQGFADALWRAVEAEERRLAGEPWKLVQR